ncbi:hypothetical protein M0Q50_06640 [bacterium]|jgi:hypothetical protein|nr:hypothetical protein [bacterium]
MTNGFYDTDNLIKTKLDEFLYDAIYSSYLVKIEEKHTKIARQLDKTKSINDFIQNFKNYKNDKKLEVIDRFAYYDGQMKKELCEYEISLHYDWDFLYIIVNEKNFNMLIEKYNLKLRNW